MPLYRNDRRDVTADNRAYLNAIRAANHVLYHHPLTKTCALHCAYQNTYYLVFGRVSFFTDAALKKPSLTVITSQHSKYF